MEQQSATNFTVNDNHLVLQSFSFSLRDPSFAEHPFRSSHGALKGNWHPSVDMILADMCLPQIQGIQQKRALHTEWLPENQAEQNVVARSRMIVQTVASQKNMGTDIIEWLTDAARLRDMETGEHIARVGRYAAMIARGLGMAEHDSEMIALAGAIHDIGKIGIGHSILLKPAPLTSQEFEILKAHTIIGEQILSASSDPLLRMAASIALTHHERWDGSGYPYGLVGEQIPLAGRIVMLADQYDALRSPRVYKPSLDHKTVCDILLRGDAITRPEHFDPKLLTLFREIEPQFAQAFTMQKNQGFTLH